MRGIVLALFLVFSAVQLSAVQPIENDSRKKYIEQWKNVAMKQMKLHGIPASITLAQGILESRSGQSSLTVKSNNHFGIKCHGWKGKKVYADDDKKNECFRKYKNADQSFEDHSQFLLRKRYEGLFNLKKSDYKGWAKGLKKAGYATDPSYAKLLIKLIEDNELTKYDKLVLKGKYEILDEVEEEIAEVKPKATRPKSTAKERGAVINLVKTYNVKRHKNNIKYVVAKGGESVKTLATTLDLAYWQLDRYNDLNSRKILNKDEVIFIQPKRNNCSVGTHKVKDGDTLLSISQFYGVKLKKIAQYNNLDTNSAVKAGQTLKLRKK